MTSVEVYWWMARGYGEGYRHHPGCSDTQELSFRDLLRVDPGPPGEHYFSCEGSEPGIGNGRSVGVTVPAEYRRDDEQDERDDAEHTESFAVGTVTPSYPAWQEKCDAYRRYSQPPRVPTKRLPRLRWRSTAA